VHVIVGFLYMLQFTLVFSLFIVISRKPISMLFSSCIVNFKLLLILLNSSKTCVMLVVVVLYSIKVSSMN
jgi:hypothetical protein